MPRRSVETVLCSAARLRQAAPRGIRTPGTPCPQPYATNRKEVSRPKLAPIPGRLFVAPYSYERGASQKVGQLRRGLRKKADWCYGTQPGLCVIRAWGTCTLKASQCL